MLKKSKNKESKMSINQILKQTLEDKGLKNKKDMTQYIKDHCNTTDVRYSGKEKSFYFIVLK